MGRIATAGPCKTTSKLNRPHVIVEGVLAVLREGGHTALNKMLRGLVVPVRMHHGPERNRMVFLAALLSADADCAEMLGGSPSKASGLCDTVSVSRHLRPAERQWAVVALTQVAGRPHALPPPLTFAFLRRLAKLLNGELCSTLQPLRQQTKAGGARALNASAANRASAFWSSSSCARSASLGLCYAAAAAIANLCRTRAGAETVIQAGLLSTLLRLLHLSRGSVSLPPMFGPLAGTHMILSQFCVGSSCCRALMNLALIAPDSCAALDVAVAGRLRALCFEAAATQNVRQIAAATAGVLDTGYLVDGADAGLSQPSTPPTSATSAVETSALRGGSSTWPTRKRRTPDLGYAARRPAPFPLDASSFAMPSNGTNHGGRERTDGSGCSGDGAEAEDFEFEEILSRRFKSRRLEYLVRWRRDGVQREGVSVNEATSWVAAHCIHHPAAVAAYERGNDLAQTYADWAWALDPAGAGWTTIPLPLHESAVRGLMSPLPAESLDNTWPDNWPTTGVQYTPFLLWESATHAMLRLRTVECHPLPCVRIVKVPPNHPAYVGRPLDGSRTRSGYKLEEGEEWTRARKGAACGVNQAGARGLSARCAIPMNTWIGDFTGLVKPQRAADSSRFLLEVFHDPLLGAKLDVDAMSFGNETRFINDYMGIAPRPNVSLNVYRKPLSGELSVGVLSLEALNVGAELLVDYGQGFWCTA